RAECIRVLTQQLERAEEEAPTLNAFIISSLVDLKAVEALPVIHAVYGAGAVDFAVLGDAEDAEIELGVRTQRSSPPLYPTLAEAYGLFPLEEALSSADFTASDTCTSAPEPAPATADRRPRGPTPLEMARA